MKEINNFDKILNELLDFDGSSVYLVHLISRAKDADSTNRTIKSYYFQNREHFESRQQEIIDLCKYFKCRAYICLNKKPIQNVLFEMQMAVTERMRQLFNGNTNFKISGLVDHSVMKAGSDGNKKWIIDVDTFDEDIINFIEQSVNEARSGFETNVITRIPTLNGVHIVTNPFNISDTGIGRDVKKEGLTLLYAHINE